MGRKNKEKITWGRYNISDVRTTPTVERSRPTPRARQGVKKRGGWGTTRERLRHPLFAPKGGKKSHHMGGNDLGESRGANKRKKEKVDGRCR